MVKKNIIQKVVEPSDWVSNMVVVKKGNGQLRICIDPMFLNKAIKRPHYMMPTIEQILPYLNNAKVFTILDARHGFWQVELDHESSKLTTFTTPFGRYRWLRLPFGIASAPEEYQRRMHETLEDLPGTHIYADDILVCGKGSNIEEAEQDHDANLSRVLERCREKNLKLNPDKTQFKKKEVTYLGHRITSAGVKADPGKIQAITDMKEPQNVKELQRFLGMITYLAKFCPNLSNHTCFLRELGKKDNSWAWQYEHQN